jgi:indole-3-glycerol phosphate synthase
MAASSRERSRAAQSLTSQADLLARALDTPEPPQLTASPGGFDLIAEVKLRSPAVGMLKGGDENVGARVTSYASAGAAAISVLTEPTRFDGSMEHLRLAAKALTPMRVPAMRKDFLVDPYQVIEARTAGAGGVLLILRMLPRAQIEAMIEQALDLKLFALLEAFDEQDIELAHALAERYTRQSSRIELLVGVNCRDLVTLKVVPGRLEALAHLLPTSVARVAESGVGNGDDARRVAAAGYDLALVGSALMTAPDPRAMASEMLHGGRAGHAEYAARPQSTAAHAQDADAHAHSNDAQLQNAARATGSTAAPANAANVSRAPSGGQAAKPRGA